jgi:hypothetical protein
MLAFLATHRRRLGLSALAVTAGLGALALSGCTPHIGDKCVLNTDCSLQGTLACDNSQPNGYCTSFNCAPDSCQNNGVCVMIYAEVPGCPYNGYQAPPRTERTMCLAVCQRNSDCRQSDGYICANPANPPLNGLIIDDNQNQSVCVVNPDYSNASWPVAGIVGIPYYDASPDVAPVCVPSGPMVSPIDAGAVD